ncbi:sensor histidine kinase [Jatrophihabitans fulvus]
MTARRIPAGAVVDAAAGALVLAAGLWAASLAAHDVTTGRLVAVAAAAVAAALARSRPGAALATVWVAGLLHLVTAPASGGLDAIAFGGLDVAALIVSYCAARHGSRTVVGLAAASIPAAAAAAVVVAVFRRNADAEPGFADVLQRVTGVGVVGAVLAGMAVLATPWTIGLLLRLEQRHRRDEAAHRVEQAHALALAEEQAARTRLTREVHDVVGHSLAVIVAQADAARLAVPDADPLVRDALERIAGVGRTSLAEVREVLSLTGGEARSAATGAADLDDLVAGVRAAGHEVTDTTTGTPVELDASSATAVYRVLQELLTNALKHGGGAIDVERVWAASGFTVRVSNPLAETPALEGGSGLEGASARLAAHGGTLHTATVRGRFVATAHLPLGAGR